MRVLPVAAAGRPSVCQGGLMARYEKAAVIPYRIRNARVEVALVTTANGKRWSVPKGSVDDGERPRHAAIREAEEEAGLRGLVARKPLGRYRHENQRGRCRVEVYVMRVTRVLERWLEDDLRRRRWMKTGAAAACLREELRPFIRDLERVLELES
jgi:8-oxo-dGTP pyrophosphatase MutT (NUDIX family)